MLKARRNKLHKIFFAFFLVICSFSLSAVDVFAHPGHLGAITHLGPRTIALSVGAAAIDSFNPTALGVLLLLMRSHQKVSSKIGGIIRIGLFYILGIVAMYLLSGYGISQLLVRSGPSLLTEGLQILLALLLFLVGVKELDGLFNKKGWFPWLEKFIDKLLVGVKPATEHFWPILLGVVFGLIELFLTGAIYLSFIRGITFDPTVHSGVLTAFIAIYLFVFTLPLFAAVYFVAFSSAINSSISKNSKAVLVFRGLIGLIFIAVSLWLTISSVNLLLSLYA